MPERFGKFNTARNRVTKLRSLDPWEPFLAKAKDLGYALTKGEYLGNERRGNPKWFSRAVQWNLKMR